jgi:hypothetical protein
MTPWFIATEHFGPDNGERWRRYIEWSGLKQLTELVSLDAMLCPSILNDIQNDYWPHIVNEDNMLAYFTDFEFLKNELTAFKDFNLLCVVRNPPCHLNTSPVDAFDFVGYDLVEAQTRVSALTNCGGFPEVFSNSELSHCGLLTDFARASEVKGGLRAQFPGEPHADCDLWAIYRAAAK